MAAVDDLAKCINADLDIETFDGLKLIIEAFLAALPDLIDISIVPDLPNFPKFAFDLFLNNLDPNFPAFSFEFNGVNISFPGANVPGFDIGTIDAGLLKFLVGLGNILINIPELFIDLDADPPVPKIPDYQVVLEFVLLQLGINAEINVIDADFALTFGNCLAKAIAKTVGIPA